MALKIILSGFGFSLSNGIVAWNLKLCCSRHRDLCQRQTQWQRTASSLSQIMSTFGSLSSRSCLIYHPAPALEPLNRWMRQGDTWRRSWVVKWDVLCCSFTCLSNWTTTTAVYYTIQEKRVLFSYERRWRRAKNCKKFIILSLFLPLYLLNAFFSNMDDAVMRSWHLCI